MISLLGALLTWVPALAPLYVPLLARELVTLLAQHASDNLDRQIPDDLPLTAGEWLAHRIARLPYPVRALVTDKAGDAYWPDDRMIQLNELTCFKADPVYWSAAAHELGHARLHAEFPVLMVLRRATARLRAVLIAAGVGLTIGRVLYALPIAGDLAFGCFAIAAGTTIVMLVDEAAASVIAYRELCASAALDAVHRRAAVRVLVTWFATYLVSNGSYALLLRYWPLVEALAGDRGARASQLTGSGHAVAIAATIGCVVAIAARLAWMLAPGPYSQALRPSLQSVARALGWISNVGLVWLAWDHRVDAAYAWCAIAAFATCYRTWIGAVDLVLMIPHRLVRYVLSSCQSHGPERSARYQAAAEQGKHLVHLGNKYLALLLRAAAEAPPWSARLIALTELGCLPLLVALWLR